MAWYSVNLKLDDKTKYKVQLFKHTLALENPPNVSMRSCQQNSSSFGVMSYKVCITQYPKLNIFCKYMINIY